MIQFEVTDGYKVFSTVFFIVLGCLCAGLVIASMVKLKKSYALSIMAAIALILGTALISFSIITFNGIQLLHVVTGSSQSEVANAASKIFLETMLKSIPLSLSGFAMFVGWLLGLIVMIVNRKKLVTGLGIAAIVLHVIRYLTITPYPFVLFVLCGGATEQIQMISDVLYGFAYLLPFILYALGAFLKREKKDAEAPVAETDTEAPAAETDTEAPAAETDN